MARARLLVALFVGMIVLPALANVAGFDGGQTTTENRLLSAFPHLDGTWDAASRWPRRLKRWFGDHFGLRATLVRWHSELSYFGLGVSPAAGVVCGRDGWLFYRGDAAMEDYARETLLQPGELDAWRESIASSQRWLQKRGIAFLFVVAPDKHVIYPEELPSTIRPARDRYRMDQLFDALRATDVAAVDLRPQLLAAKRDQRVYEKTDSHWNDRGAFVAYQRIVEAIRRQGPAVPAAWTGDDFDTVTMDEPGMDLARLMGLEDVVREQRIRLVPKRARAARVIDPPDGPLPGIGGRVVTEIAGSTLPRVVVFRDSFATALIPFLSEHFSRAVYLWHYDIDPDVIEKEHPAVVIQEIVGRHLRHPPGTNVVAE
jgi:alginate O-acetyltransferase complex protein AlgJ